MKTSDVIIVGAGPAGSTCAASLKKSGFTVQLLDKQVFPRVKPCAGWVTPQVIEALGMDVSDYRRSNTWQPITGFRTGMIGGPMVDTDYHEAVSFGIRRIEFDEYLLKQSGVLCNHSPVRKIERANGQWVINESFIAPVVIGAGGHFCPISRYVRGNRDLRGSAAKSDAELDLPPPLVVYAKEVEFEMSSRQRCRNHIDPEKPELYFCRDLKGYGWCFRKGNFLNIGLGRIDKTDLSSHVQEFCDFVTSQRKRVDSLPPHFLGHAYQLYAETIPPLFDEGVLLIGDAAGLAYAQSGEGIRPAVESAMIAADVIANANGDYGHDSLSAYRTRLLDRLGPPKPYQTVNWLPVSWLETIAARLMVTRWFAQSVVVDNWFLHRQQAALIPFQESTRECVDCRFDREQARLTPAHLESTGKTKGRH